MKPQKDVWLKKPAKKLIGLAKGKNCQATACENTDSKSQSFKCSDKNCQEIINMWSVTKKTDVWLPKPAVPYGYSMIVQGQKLSIYQILY